jgi:hypothetical protein
MAKSAIQYESPPRIRSRRGQCGFWMPYMFPTAVPFGQLCQSIIALRHRNIDYPAAGLGEPTGHKGGKLI